MQKTIFLSDHDRTNVNNRTLDHTPLDHRNFIKDDSSAATLSLALSPSGHLYLYQNQYQDPDQEREELMSFRSFLKSKTYF